MASKELHVSIDPDQLMSRVSEHIDRAVRQAIGELHRGAVVVNPGDTLVVATDATNERAKRFGDQLREALPDTVKVLVVSATALAVVRGAGES